MVMKWELEKRQCQDAGGKSESGSLSFLVRSCGSPSNLEKKKVILKQFVKYV